MSGQLVKVEIVASDEAILEKKKAWSEVGEVIHNTNLSLTNQVNNAIAKLIPPTSIEQVVEAESTLAEIKKDLKAIELERKNVTAKFDTVTEKLMNPEKQLAAALKTFAEGILKLKQEAEKIANDAKQKEADFLKWKQEYTNQINKKYSDMKDYVANICQKAYAHALRDGTDVTEANLASFLDQVKLQRFNEKAFTPEFNLENMSHAVAWKEAWQAASIPNPAEMLLYADIELKKKFEFFNVALKNKAEAIAAAAAAEAKAKADREAEAAAKVTATKLETMAATTVVVDTGIKETKKTYAIDMPDDVPNNLLIANAFIASYEQVKGGIRVKSLRKLSIEQMGDALAWAKNQDDRFAFTGIKFKIIEKL